MNKVIALNPYDSQSQVIYDANGVAPALCSGCARWGGLTPRILEMTAYCLQGNMIGRKERNGPQGGGYKRRNKFYPKHH